MFLCWVSSSFLFSLFVIFSYFRTKFKAQITYFLIYFRRKVLLFGIFPYFSRTSGQKLLKFYFLIDCRTQFLKVRLISNSHLSKSLGSWSWGSVLDSYLRIIIWSLDFNVKGVKLIQASTVSVAKFIAYLGLRLFTLWHSALGDWPLRPSCQNNPNQSGEKWATDDVQIRSMWII